MIHDPFMNPYLFLIPIRRYPQFVNDRMVRTWTEDIESGIDNIPDMKYLDSLK
jgi:hypothetical protein